MKTYEVCTVSLRRESVAPGGSEDSRSPVKFRRALRRVLVRERNRLCRGEEIGARFCEIAGEDSVEEGSIGLRSTVEKVIIYWNERKRDGKKKKKKNEEVKKKTRQNNEHLGHHGRKEGCSERE